MISDLGFTCYQQVLKTDMFDMELWMSFFQFDAILWRFSTRVGSDMLQWN